MMILRDCILSFFEAGYIIVKRPKLPVFRLDPPLIIDKSILEGFVVELSRLLSERG